MKVETIVTDIHHKCAIDAIQKAFPDCDSSDGRPGSPGNIELAEWLDS